MSGSSSILVTTSTGKLLLVSISGEKVVLVDNYLGHGGSVTAMHTFQTNHSLIKAYIADSNLALREYLIVENQILLQRNLHLPSAHTIADIDTTTDQYLVLSTNLGWLIQINLNNGELMDSSDVSPYLSPSDLALELVRFQSNSFFIFNPSNPHPLLVSALAGSIHGDLVLYCSEMAYYSGGDGQCQSCRQSCSSCNPVDGSCISCADGYFLEGSKPGG